jgi:hypothetical protein
MIVPASRLVSEDEPEPATLCISREDSAIARWPSSAVFDAYNRVNQNHLKVIRAENR